MQQENPVKFKLPKRDNRFGVNRLKFLLPFLVVGVLAAGLESCRGKKRFRSWFSRGASTTSATNLSGNRKAPKEEILKVIAAARSYTGTPHVDGGVSRNGIDCSGLMLMAFHKVGITLPRRARDQALKGYEVAKNEIRPGDMVFFADPRIGPGITHVGLVTELRDDGIVRFIHTSSKLGVMESNLTDGYFAKHYKKAVRVW